MFALLITCEAKGGGSFCTGADDHLGLQGVVMYSTSIKLMLSQLLTMSPIVCGGCLQLCCVFTQHNCSQM